LENQACNAEGQDVLNREDRSITNPPSDNFLGLRGFALCLVLRLPNPAAVIALGGCRYARMPSLAIMIFEVSCGKDRTSEIDLLCLLT
jgi:hypothetical protein